jgi:hypothetical protein
MARPKVAAVPVLWYSVAVVAAALLPSAMIWLPALGTMLLPRGLLLLLLRGLRVHVLLLWVLPLLVLVLLLLLGVLFLLLFLTLMLLGTLLLLLFPVLLIFLTLLLLGVLLFAFGLLLLALFLFGSLLLVVLRLLPHGQDQRLRAGPEGLCGWFQLLSSVLPPEYLVLTLALLRLPVVRELGLCHFSCSNMDPGKRMEQPKHVQQPHNDGNHHDAIQDWLNGGLHWDEAIYQPQKNPHHDQNFQQLN